MNDATVNSLQERVSHVHRDNDHVQQLLREQGEIEQRKSARRANAVQVGAGQLREELPAPVLAERVRRPSYSLRQQRTANEAGLNTEDASSKRTRTH